MSMGWDYVSELRPRRQSIIDRGNQITWRETCPSATLSITNLTWADLGANPGLRCDSYVPNHLSHSTATPKSK
jgi:hypothetical protein